MFVISRDLVSQDQISGVEQKRKNNPTSEGGRSGSLETSIAAGTIAGCLCSAAQLS